MRSKIAYGILIVLLVLQAKSIWSLSDKRLCADPKCEKIISLAKAKISYSGNEKGKISFSINSPIRVKSKSAGRDPSLWGIEVQGRSGYAPKEYILEEKIYIKEKDLKYEIDVEESIENAAKQAIDVPSVKLKPSEVITEEKVQPTEVPKTMSLESKSEDLLSVLNASESDIEPTTAPLSTENGEIVNQSLREMVTPVQKSFEIIDGTTIPIADDNQIVDTGNELNEAATTTTETKTNPSLDKIEQTTNEAPLLNKNVENLNLVEIKDDKSTEVKKQGGEDVMSTEKKETITDDRVNEQQDQHEQATKDLNEIDAKVASIVEDNVQPPITVESVDAFTTEQGTVASNKTQEENTLNLNTVVKSEDISKESLAEHPDLTKGLNEIKDNSEKVTQDINDVSQVVVQHEEPSSSATKETTSTGLFDNEVEDVADPNETGTFLDPTLTGSNFDNGNEDDDDEDENDDDDQEYEDEVRNNITLANTDITTPKTTHDVTTVAHETIPKINYWEVDGIDATTPNPKLAAEEKPETNVNEARVQETITSGTVVDGSVESSNETVGTMPEVGATESENMLNNMQEPNTQPSSETVETITVQPEVPYIHTVLPLFQQPTIPPIKPEEQPNMQHLYYDNPNNYPEQNSILQAESITEAAHVEYRTESTTPAPTYSEHKHHSLNIEEYSNSNIETNEMPPTVSPIQNINSEIPSFLPKEEKREAGLFTTMLGTVNTFVNKLRKEPQESGGQDETRQHILYTDRFVNEKPVQKDEQFCEKLSQHHCPSTSTKDSSNQQCNYDWSHINMDNFVDIFLAKMFEMRDILSCLAITASSCLLFLFGYYCFCNSSREGALISKLNQLERSLLASHKENAILKDDLLKTRSKLTSIEDNSFGSDDMVIDLKKEVENLSAEKNQLQEHVHSLEKELEQAAEAGLELNKIVADLLNNQSGHESMIMNSVEDLQLQFNEQQKTIIEINSNLAEKSRENSELQLMLAEQNVRFNGEIASLQQDNDELEAEKANLQTRLDELKTEFEEDITKALEGKNVEIKRLQNEIMDIKNRFEDIHTKWKTSLAKIEALEDCMKTMKKDPNVNIGDVINAANVKAELLDLQQQRVSLKSLLETEREGRQHAESNLKNTISDVDRLKQDFHKSEKDKLEAQTRLEVLSNYFKEKETQLQKELSLKEAIWLKQQGENTSTVDRMTAMQDEIQSLKSQNDALRAEIEAQIAAHKAQTGTLENRAHETWLAARQSERRYEEARAEAAALRRRLTELSGLTNSIDPNRTTIDNNMTSAELNNVPSPILPPPLMDTAGSPLLGRLPPPQFLPFMGPPPPPFLNLPPPPFLSSVEMRPAPLGRMMSPPLGRYSPPPPQRERDRSDYYQDDYSDDDDEEDYEDDDYDYDDSPRHRRRRRSGNGSDSWRRDNYSPPPPDRSYRSHSPADSRYNYATDRDLVSTYETDISPPASPREQGGISGNRSRTGNYAYSSQSTSKVTKESTAAAKKSNKAVPNSDSDKSYSSTHHKKKGKSMV